ncbi:PucR family transcriptional regulator ligand-binding domain-containing protein [Streptomyces sp. NPDC050504]|uniref:PucR family transcriptional regulator ligand-binding domain-containing protein n=1 Tax=Streptomyces sp. NPDC050504 TaxID=3365618 RepID=UPI0037B04F13
MSTNEITDGPMGDSGPAGPAARPGPPTPPVPLSALLPVGRGGGSGLGLRLLTGDRDTAVHWVHTSEMADPYPYLLGGELLLTAGVQLTDPERYVARVAEAGAAALGFGVTPVYDTVPDALLAACVRHGLPLVEVAPGTPFTAVARAVWRLMAEARHRELRRVTRAQQALAAAAARPDPVPAVLRTLASRLDGRAVLFAGDGAPLHAAGRLPSDATDSAESALGALAGIVRTGPASATDTAPGAHLAAYALTGAEPGGDGSPTGPPAGSTAPPFVLGVATPAREPGDRTVAGIAAVLLTLLTAPHRGADPAHRSAALVRLLLGAAPGEAAGLLGAAPWRVVHARGGDGTPFAAPALGAALGSTLVDGGGGEDGTVRILLPTPGGSPVPALAPQPGWTLGVSAPVDPAAPTAPTGPAALAAADAQAARALRRAEATRVPLVQHREAGLTGLVAPDEAAAHARTALAPLADAPPALADTLRTWLSLHGSWDRTATALAVHRNTVRQRVARCAALLEADLDDPDVRMELWFALRWLPGATDGTAVASR